MAITTAISSEKVVLNQILRDIEIHFDFYMYENELRVSIDESKLINSISNITKIYRDAFKIYTGTEHSKTNIDKIIIAIDDYVIEAKEENIIISQSVSNGFKKVLK
jgi:hypothetical protein